jgi:hypothetical protein
MLSIKDCKEILENGGKKYKDEQVKLIRNILYQLAEIEYQNIRNKNHVQKSHYLYESLNN